MPASFSRAAAAAVIGSALLLAGGCAKDHRMPASPVAMPLNDFQAIEIAENYLDDRDGGATADADDRERHVAYVEPTGDGHIVSFRSAFEADARPPIASRLVLVKHTGAVREMRLRRDE